MPASRSLRRLAPAICEGSPTPSSHSSAGELSPISSPPPASGQDETDRDGTLAIQDGALVFKPARGSGRHPVILPGPNVRVLVNGRPVRRPRTVKPGSQVRVELLHEKPRLDIQVTVSPDRLTAYLTVDRRPGIRYRLADRPPGPELRVETRTEGIAAAPAMTEETLRDVLASYGVTFGIDGDALRDIVCRSIRGEDLSGKAIPVARGIPPVEPVDDAVGLTFESVERRRAVNDDDPGALDLLGLFEIVSVKPGDVVAEFRPGKPGSPGTDVYGNTIPVRPPRRLQVRTGRGVVPDSSGTVFIAKQGGRPVYRRGRIDIHPLYRVLRDLDVQQGHVTFDGDVIVPGDILDQLRVVAEGRVVVGRSVSGARIIAKEGVEIGRGIHRSRIFAGTGIATLPDYVRSLEQLTETIDQLCLAAHRLQSSPMFRNLGNGTAPVKELVRRLLAQRFPRIVPRLRLSLDLLERHEWEGEGSRDRLQLALEQAWQALSGARPRYITELYDVRRLNERLKEAVQELSERPVTPADVVSPIIHNSTIHATGTIYVTEGQCYYARLLAGTGVFIRAGAFRGHHITVHRGDVVIGEAGTPSGSGRATVDIVEDGVFRAARVHPGVELSIGGQRHVFTDIATGVAASLKDGKLVVNADEGQTEFT